MIEQEKQMSQRMKTLLLQYIVAVTVLAACSSTTAQSTDTNTQPVQVVQNTTAGTSTATQASASPTTTSTSTATATTVLAENTAPIVVDESATATATESSNIVQITLQGDTITAEGIGVTVNGNIATITTGGTYNIRGTLNDGQIVVDTTDEETVYLILSGATLNNSTSAPLYVEQATAIEIILADGSNNYLTDGASYAMPVPKKTSQTPHFLVTMHWLFPVVEPSRFRGITMMGLPAKMG